MTRPLSTLAGRRACAACGGPLELAETIETAALAEAWRREDRVAGRLDTIGARTRDIHATLPAVVEFERCLDCGLEMAAPPRVWSASTYPRDQSYPIRWEFSRSLDDLGPWPLDLLEIGCGTGWFLEQAGQRGHRAVGIDFSDTAVAQAAARGARAFRGGFDELAGHLGRDARFDAVALFHVIEHVGDPDALFGAIDRWTRPGAQLVLSCPGPRRFTRVIHEQAVGRRDFWDYPPQHVLRWTLPALRSVCARHGWRVVTAMEEPFSWIAAGSHVGIARAQYRGVLARPVRRRFSIAAGWWRLLRSPALRHGVSLYLHAVRAGEPAR
jgi:SAM-dependent methyltransferase